jgi:translation initiation factor 2 beta subunit (eIF-2beta)/eIF-5
MDYFMSELGCEGNIGFNNEMILVGGYQAKHFLRLIRKYIEDYVRCKDCRGYKT